MPELGRDEARRIAVRAQLLDAERPESLVALVDHLTLLQIDPTAAVAPNADLVAWSRLGRAYDPSDLRFALETERSLVELSSYVRPMEDVGMVLALARAELHPSMLEWVGANASFRADVLALLAAEGPLSAAEIPDTAAVPWRSSGWNNDKNVNRLLEVLARLGDVAVSGRRGRLRIWDLADRVYPSDLVIPSPQEAAAESAMRRLAALGIARSSAKGNTGEQLGVGPIGLPCRVVGCEGECRVDPDALAALNAPFAGRAALLSPFDRVVFDRERVLDLFDFDYVLEMYKPAAQRRWGYFALPILFGERLLGKLDAKADRKTGVLQVFAVHEDTPWDPEVGDAVEAEIDALATWLGLEVVRASH